MKVKILFLAAAMGLGHLASAQTATTKWYEPSANTVKVGFTNEFATSEQKTAEGNRMVVAYEKGSKYNFSLTSVYPLMKSEDMAKAIEDRFLKLIAYQVDYYKTQTGTALVPATQSLAALTGQPGFATSFVIGDYTYQYRVVVLDNVFYMLSASYPTANKGDKVIAEYFNSFAKVEAPKPINDEE